MAWSFTSLPTLPSVTASRPNSLASTTSVRSSRPRCLQIEDQLRHRRVDHLLHRLGARVPVLVAVPVHERDVLRRHLDVARAGFDQAPREQAALSEAAGVVRLERGLRLEREVERLRRRRAQQAIGAVERAHQRLALEVAAVLVHRFLREQLLEQLPAALEPRRPELLRRPHGGRRILRIDDQERAVLGAEEAAVWNALSVPISPAPSTVWPIVMKAGMSGSRGPSVRETYAPMCGIAIGCGGT